MNENEFKRESHWVWSTQRSICNEYKWRKRLNLSSTPGEWRGCYASCHLTVPPASWRDSYNLKMKLNFKCIQIASASWTWFERLFTRYNCDCDLFHTTNGVVWNLNYLNKKTKSRFQSIRFRNKPYKLMLNTETKISKNLTHRSWNLF